MRMATKRLEELEAAPYNPRSISEPALAGLAASIRRFGLVQPVVWNERTGRVVSGHQRLRVLRDSGATETDVVVVDLPEVEERQLNIAQNSPAISGEFTSELQTLLAELVSADAVSFDELRLGELLTPTEVTPKPELDDAPALPAVAVAKLGDLWLLGEHRVACGSSTDPEVVARVFGDQRASCMWTDPPYGIDHGNSRLVKRRGVINDELAEPNLGQLLREAFALADQHLAPGAAVYLAHPATAIGLAFPAALVEAGWQLKQMLVWVKDRIGLSQADYHWSHEGIAYASKGIDKRHGRFGVGWHGDDSQRSVFDIARPRRSEEHPTMKPVELVARMVANSTKPGDLVYDPFSGSGTTLIACESLGRRCAAVELEPRYVDVVVERWQTLTGGKATRA